MGEHADGTVSAGAADDRLHARVEPHAHEILGASLVLAALKSSDLSDFGIEQHGVSRALERFHAALEPSFARRIRWCDDSDRVALLESGWANELWKGFGNFRVS